MKALSIRAPWWWFCLHGGKSHENRDWYTKYRGPLLLQASTWWNEMEVLEDLYTGEKIMRSCGNETPLPSLQELRAAGGKIVGRVEVTGCVAKSGSPWFFGKYGICFMKPVVFDEAARVPVRGQLGLFDVSADLMGA